MFNIHFFNQKNNLFIFSRILGFTIPYERGSIHSNKLFKIYSLFVILSSTTLTLATWYYRLVINYKKMQATVVLTDVLESSTVLILHIILILYTVFLDEDSRTKFAVLMIDLNTVLSFSKKVKKMFTHEKVFVIVYFCTIALCVAYIGIWTKIVGFEMEKFFIVKEVQICVCVLGISQFYYLNLRLIDFLTNFNQMLSVCAECQEIVVTLTDQSSKDKKRSVSLKIEDFPRIYQKLCDVVDIANAVYGYPLLFCVSLIMMRIIGTINVSVVFDRYPLTICISVLWTLTSTVNLKNKINTDANGVILGACCDDNQFLRSGPCRSKKVRRNWIQINF